MDAQVDYDLLIVGGGMVGASLVHALAGHGLRMAMIEAVPPAQGSPSFDDRAIALSHGTGNILRSLGLWSELQKVIEPIKKIHVSEKGQFGFARLDQAEEKVDALGYVISAQAFGEVLLAPLSGLNDLTLLCPATLESFEVHDSHVVARVREGDSVKSLSAKLLLAADGGQSKVREQLGIEVTEKIYHQHAVVANVETARPHQNVAFERFTEQGPVALLPMQSSRSALVYTIPSQDVDDVLALPDHDFLKALQARFGYRLGRFTRIGTRHAYELIFREVKEHIRPRVALIGNAAHTIHPIAGQGFNLGIRDVAVMAEVILQQFHQGRDFGLMENLGEYAGWREKDHREVLGATDNLVRLFTNPLPVVRFGRNLGILGLGVCAPARHWLSRHAMGLAGRQPRLARGLPLV